MRRVGNASREAERRIMDALQARLSARMERAMAASIAREYRAAARAVERREPWAVQGQDTGRILLAGWETTAIAFGNRMSNQLGKSRRQRIERKDIGAAFRAAFLQFATEWIATKVTQINSTTEEQIRAVILAGEDEGASVEAIAKRIRAEALPSSRLRSHVIARTETHFAAGWANEQAATESGILLQKEWVATTDARTRESHLEVDGEVVAMSGAFNVGGALLRYPGDPSGPAEEVINCRCQAIYIEP